MTRSNRLEDIGRIRERLERLDEDLSCLQGYDDYDMFKRCYGIIIMDIDSEERLHRLFEELCILREELITCLYIAKGLDDE